MSFVFPFGGICSLESKYQVLRSKFFLWEDLPNLGCWPIWPYATHLKKVGNTIHRSEIRLFGSCLYYRGSSFLGPIYQKKLLRPSCPERDFHGRNETPSAQWGRLLNHKGYFNIIQTYQYSFVYQVWKYLNCVTVPSHDKNTRNNCLWVIIEITWRTDPSSITRVSCSSCEVYKGTSRWGYRPLVDDGTQKKYPKLYWSPMFRKLNRKLVDL